MEFQVRKDVSLSESQGNRLVASADDEMTITLVSLTSPAANRMFPVPVTVEVILRVAVVCWTTPIKEAELTFKPPDKVALPALFGARRSMHHSRMTLPEVVSPPNCFISNSVLALTLKEFPENVVPLSRTRTVKVAPAPSCVPTSAVKPLEVT